MGKGAYRLFFELQYVGKLIRAAKRRVTWKFAFEGDNDEHSVVLQHTLNSGKKVVFLNGNQIFEDEQVRADGALHFREEALQYNARREPDRAATLRGASCWHVTPRDCWRFATAVARSVSLAPSFSPSSAVLGGRLCVPLPAGWPPDHDRRRVPDWG